MDVCNVSWRLVTGQRLSQYWALEAAVTEAAWVRGGQAGGLHGVMHSTPVQPLYTITQDHHNISVSCHSTILTGDEAKLQPPFDFRSAESKGPSDGRKVIFMLSCICSSSNMNL